MLLTHARRTGVLPEEHRPKVFNTRTPQSMPTFMVDGRVAGSWKYEKGKVKLEPFERLDAAAKRELRRGRRPTGGAARLAGRGPKAKQRPRHRWRQDPT